MRSRLAIDGAITAYRKRRTGGTLKGKRIKESHVYQAVFEACEVGEGVADLCKQSGARTRFAAEVRR
jgi:hypothetical protein